MSPLGNANQLAMVKQFMILEEMQSGYGKLTDGQMFKQVGDKHTAAAVLPML